MTVTYATYSSEEFISKVGNTPLIKYEALSNELGRNIYFKLESSNPGQSIKDRAAVYLLRDAIARGLQSGDTLVEATAGNTGISLALLARSFDPPYKVRLFVPDVLIQDKVDLLESLGCTVVKCRVDVDQKHPDFFLNVAQRYVDEHEGAFYVDQTHNVNNKRAHFETTGPEIWNELQGNVDGFVAAAGTGGTLSGVSQFLKSQKEDIVIWAADRYGSGLTSYVTTGGRSWESEGDSFVEGIGKKFLTTQMEGLLDRLDSAVTIDDTTTIVTIYKLYNDQGIWVGPSAGVNIAAAAVLAKRLPEGSTVVTTAADLPQNYASKLFNREWLESAGHWDSIPQELRKYATYSSV